MFVYIIVLNAHNLFLLVYSGSANMTWLLNEADIGLAEDSENALRVYRTLHERQFRSPKWTGFNTLYGVSKDTFHSTTRSPVLFCSTTLSAVQCPAPRIVLKL